MHQDCCIIQKCAYLCNAIKGNKLDKANGFVAQLNRASDYGSEGYRFESCRGHKIKKKLYGSVAQLNRASDYGSEGYRFESCRGHKKD